MHPAAARKLRPVIHHMASHRYQGAAQALVSVTRPWPRDFPYQWTYMFAGL